MAELLLDVQDVHVHFPVSGGTVRALDGVSMQVAKGEAVAVVGESGCGKTTLARAVLGLQPLASGSINLNGEPVGRPRPGLAKRVGMVWQDPFASIEPLWKISRALEEPFRLAGEKGDIETLLGQVGLSPTLANRYPHELSGGQRQRAAIARAIALRPPLVICDEPTAALDLSIQAQILNLLLDLKQQTSCSFLYISHDLQTVRYISDRVCVMYMGKLVESGPTQEVFENPRHRYTKALLDSAPSIETLGRLPEAVPGEIPDQRTEFVGCKFASRCPIVETECTTRPIEWDDKQGHGCLCRKPLDLASPGLLNK